MRLLLTIALGVCLFSCKSPGRSNTRRYREYHDEQAAESGDTQAIAPSGPSYGVKLGFSQGAGLRQIAQGSADQANTAVANQHAAAVQAAFVAKNTLAQSAAQASATAQAALAGKQILLQGIEQQLRDAKVAVDGESQQLMQAQRAADAAQNSAQQAMHQVNVIQAALNAAQATSDHASQAASEAAGEFAAQRAMVGAAKQRVNQIHEQLDQNLTAMLITTVLKPLLTIITI
ncbi:hypothetical protein CBL_02458 [Carabus blaptoides fortunei]